MRLTEACKYQVKSDSMYRIEAKLYFDMMLGSGSEFG